MGEGGFTWPRPHTVGLPELAVTSTSDVFGSVYLEAPATFCRRLRNPAEHTCPRAYQLDYTKKGQVLSVVADHACRVAGSGGLK